MRLAGADAARPAGGARQVQRALHPFECRFVVVEAGETVADIDGGRDRAAQLPAFQRRLIALHVVAGGRAQVARFVRQQAAEVMHPGCQRRWQLAAGAVSLEVPAPACLGGWRIAQDGPARHGRVGQAGTHRIAGAARLLRRRQQFGVAADMVAPVNRDRREQPVGVGAASTVAVRTQDGVRRPGAFLGNIQFAM